MFARWLRGRKPLLGASAAAAPAMRQADCVDLPCVDAGAATGPLVAAPGAVRAPEGASQNQTPPVVAPTPPAFPELSSPELSRMHARLLLGWIADSDWTHPLARADVVAVEDGKPVLLASSLLEIYREMCAEKAIAERPWNPVAKELKALTGDRKGYAWVERDGVKHRLRVYRLDVALLAPSGAHGAPGAATIEPSAPAGASLVASAGAARALEAQEKRRVA